jgi:hypothetical protein
MISVIFCFLKREKGEDKITISSLFFLIEFSRESYFPLRFLFSNSSVWKMISCLAISPFLASDFESSWPSPLGK